MFYVESSEGFVSMYGGCSHFFAVAQLHIAHYKSVERSVIWKGAREWNGLETGVRNIATKSHFKAVQKKWLLATLGQPIQ